MLADEPTANLDSQSSDQLMERICDPLNLECAMARVIANGGAPGVDGMTVKELEKYFERHRDRIIGELRRNLVEYFRVLSLWEPLERDREAERRCLQQLCCWAYSITPSLYTWREDCLQLEIGGCLSLFHGLDSLLAEVLAGISSRGYQVEYGLAATFAVIDHQPEGVADAFLARDVG